MDRNHVFSFSGLPPVFPYALTIFPDIPKPLTTRAFSICCAACHTPNSPTTPMSGLPPPVRLISHARFLIFSALIYDLILYQYICLLCLIRIFTLISYSYVIPE